MSYTKIFTKFLLIEMIAFALTSCNVSVVETSQPPVTDTMGDVRLVAAWGDCRTWVVELGPQMLVTRCGIDFKTQKWGLHPETMSSVVIK